jgi:SepF-like predicted cell division protein (DUF552 family)
MNVSHESIGDVTINDGNIIIKDTEGLWESKFDSKKIKEKIKKKKVMKQEYIWMICDQIKDNLTLNL